MNSLATLVILLLILAAVCYVISLTPISVLFKRGIIGVIVLVAVIYVIKFLFGLSGAGMSIR